MQKEKIDMFLISNADKFSPMAIPGIREMLEKMDDDKIYVLQSVSWRDPTLILVIAIVLGWERFFIDDIGLGILKVLTCQGFGIWWIVDMFTAIDRAKKYNYRRFLEIAHFM